VPLRIRIIGGTTGNDLGARILAVRANAVMLFALELLMIDFYIDSLREQLSMDR